jgi:Ca2+-transporting ATPase
MTTLNPLTAAKPWHALTAEEAVAALGTDARTGLTETETRARLSQYGYNQLTSAAPLSIIGVLANQFKNHLIAILLVATALSIILGQTVEATAIGAIILFAVLLGFYQEYRAERAIEALQELAAPLALTLRGGDERKIPAQELVPGDIILLNAGDRIPADARLLEEITLKIDEAVLTGESVPAEKDSRIVIADDAVVGDRRNMVFAGTSAVYGRGRAVVVATGMQTEFGLIAGLLRSVERTSTPLQKNLAHIGQILTKAALALVIGIVLLGALQSQPVLEMIIFGIALAVAVVPEALPAVVTISLAIGVQHMARRHALVRHLPAAETLGSTSIICSDKTGTLTKDEMTVRKILIDSETVIDVTGSGYQPVGEFLSKGEPYPVTASLRLLLQASALCSDAHLEETDGVWDVKGDSTEGALVVAAEKAGLKKVFLDERHRRVAEIPFNSDSKRMTTLHETAAGTMAYGKGAAEVILASSNRYQVGDEVRPLTDETRAAILETAEIFAAQALRVVGVAYAATPDIALAETDMVFLGLLGMMDPPRPEAGPAIARCHEAGIRVMMITGDHPTTAKAVAQELGLLPPGAKTLTGKEIAALSETELEERLQDTAVCARVSPAHKLRIVAALQRLGHVVAMTGDGVNDAPALKKADIGIAMGITGTDVSREAADMTLTDDNFASIVAAVEEGRIIYDNIKKYLRYLLSSNIGEIGLVTGASLLGLPLPLAATQILYVNLATDGLPALALAFDPSENDTMRRPPRRPNDNIFSRRLIVLMTTGGLWSTLVNLGLFVWYRDSGHSTAETMTMVFVSLVLIQFFKAYSFRSIRHSLWSRPFANHALNWSIAAGLLLLGLVIYLPFLHAPLNTIALAGGDWLVAIVGAATVLPVLELAKKLLRRAP